MLVELIATESAPIELQLNIEQLSLLRALGRELAANSMWWREERLSPERSVVEIRLLGDDKYAIKFRDVIGVVRLGDVQVRVRPKIPESHFSHIIRRSDIAPRTTSSVANVEAGTDYSELLALWCVTEAEALLRRGLRWDYSEYVEELREVRGRLDVLSTAMANHLGRPVAACVFEELGEDTALNRVLKAACQSIAAQSRFKPSVRRAANRVVTRMESVSPLKAADRHVRLTRLTSGYGRAFPLAKLVLESGGISVKVGRYAGSAFLIRTPELVENGLRNIISDGLLGAKVRKQRLLLGESGISINPDLVFGGGVAIGDIKYRHLGPDWDRNSLYQAVAFATGFHANHCGIFGFSAGIDAKFPKKVPVGHVLARSFAWRAAQDFPPHESEKLLLREVNHWLSEVR
jgi:5-methylcytosine-specific restriction enzyme subunit McrC